MNKLTSHIMWARTGGDVTAHEVRGSEYCRY